MNGPAILCLGNDASLLQTRTMVLQTRFGVSHCSTPSEAAARWPGCPFEVIVLCHTLSDREFDEAERYAQQRTPPAHLLALQAVRPVHSSRSARAVRNLDGPEPLLRAVTELIRASQA